MRKAEAVALAMQLGFKIKSISDFEDQLESAGLEITLDNPTGDWVVIRKGDRNGTALARVA